jgi:hypothetical protein
MYMILKKYGNSNSKQLIYWSGLQAVLTLVIICLLFNNVGVIEAPNIFIYGFFIFLTVYSYRAYG